MMEESDKNKNKKRIRRRIGYMRKVRTLGYIVDRPHGSKGKD
jgi:hypothetical protein